MQFTFRFSITKISHHSLHYPFGDFFFQLGPWEDVKEVLITGVKPQVPNFSPKFLIFLINGLLSATHERVTNVWNYRCDVVST